MPKGVYANQSELQKRRADEYWERVRAGVVPPPDRKEFSSSEKQRQHSLGYWERVRAGELPSPERKGKKSGGHGEICGMSQSDVLHLSDENGVKLGCGKPITSRQKLDLHSLDGNHEKWEPSNKIYMHSRHHSKYHQRLRNKWINKTEAGRERQRQRILEYWRKVRDGELPQPSRRGRRRQNG